VDCACFAHAYIRLFEMYESQVLSLSTMFVVSIITGEEHDHRNAYRVLICAELILCAREYIRTELIVAMGMDSCIRHASG
jgi:hypothetical protein